MKRRFDRRKIRRLFLPLSMGTLAIWLLILSFRSEGLRGTFSPPPGTVAQKLVQWELGDLWGTDGLALSTVLALRQAPQVMALRQEIVPLINSDTADNVRNFTPVPSQQSPAYQQVAPTYDDNGVPAQTVKPTAAGGYTVIDGIYIKNASKQTLDEELLAQPHFAARLTDDVPQVLIIHTHGSEAYTLPKGQSYPSTGTYRTNDARYSVIRVGDEVATTLSSYGISVLHDRALYDDPYYDGAYDRAADAIAAYQEKYPSLTYIIDLHRDAVQDVKGNQYKLVSDDHTIAQISMVMGSSHEGWEENLKLAMAVSREVESAHPTVMRPITLRNSNYNQAASLGMVLVEIGAAGNSLDEAVHAGQVFGDGFAQAIIKNSEEK